MNQDRPFSRRSFFDQPELVGARWWQEELAIAPDPVNRRSALKTLLLIGGGILGLGLLGRACAGLAGEDEIDNLDSLTLQRDEGWNAGAASAALVFPRSTTQNARGEPVSPALGLALANQFAPVQADLRPYYVPTLLQAPAAPNNGSLLTAMQAIHTEVMDVAFNKARALLSLFQEVSSPRDVALVVDLPGPEAVAFAAGLSEFFEPVLLFDNWPHPKGVVPSHLALGALYYYAPLFKEAAALRTPPAPPAFVVDSARLSPYTDDSDKFDNRYVAKLPSAERLKALGTKHILYVTADTSTNPQELDDLNEEFVAFQGAGLDIKVLSLGDFGPGAEPPTPEPLAPSSQPGQASAASTHYRPVFLLSPPIYLGPPMPYYYGGSWASHPSFWGSYGWYNSPRTAYASPPPRPISRGSSYRPAPRPTIFSSRAVGGSAAGVGKQKPSGFGRVSKSSSYHPSYGSSSYSGGRSGSYGRGSSSSS